MNGGEKDEDKSHGKSLWLKRPAKSVPGPGLKSCHRSERVEYGVKKLKHRFEARAVEEMNRAMLSEYCPGLSEEIVLKLDDMLTLFGSFVSEIEANSAINGRSKLRLITKISKFCAAAVEAHWKIKAKKSWNDLRAGVDVGSERAFKDAPARQAEKARTKKTRKAIRRAEPLRRSIREVVAARGLGLINSLEFAKSIAGDIRVKLGCQPDEWPSAPTIRRNVEALMKIDKYAQT